MGSVILRLTQVLSHRTEYFALPPEHFFYPMPAADNPFTPLVERIYDIVVAPDRLEELVDAWSRQLQAGAPSVKVSGLLAQPQVLAHVTRVEPVLRDYVTPDPAAGDGWTDRIANAAFITDRRGKVLAANSSAVAALTIFPGNAIDALGLEREDEAVLARKLREGQAFSNDRELVILRLSRRGEGLPIMARLIFTLQGNPDQIGVITSVIRWPRRIASVLHATFGTTDAEAEVLHELVMGQSVKEIAEESGRSEATLRSHVRALLEKTQTRT